MKTQGRGLKIKEFENWLTRLGYAESTIQSYSLLLRNFFKFLNGSKPTQTKIEAFNEALHKRSIGRRYIANHINVINLYSRYLELSSKQKLIVGKIKVEKDIPSERTIFSPAEINQLFKQTVDNTPFDFYDKTLLNIYYGCGLRCSEGVNLKVSAIDFNKGLLYVKPGKNYTARHIPLSKQIQSDLREYLLYAKPIINKESPYLLPGIMKAKTYPQYLNKRFKDLQEKAGITKDATLHSLRHSIATHLLQKGMNMEHIAHFLGHKSLDSTQIYVRMNLELMNIDN